MAKIINSSFFKIAIALSAFGVIFYLTDVNKLIVALSNLNLLLICWLMTISFLLVYISALKWSLFLSSQGNHVSVIRLFCYYLLGYFVNLLFPSYVGGDVVRSLYAGKHGNKTQAFVATVLERYTGFLAMFCMAIICVWFTAIVTWQIQLTIVLLFLALIFGSLLAVSNKIEVFLRFLRIPVKFSQKLLNFQSSLLYIKARRWLFVRAMGLSFLFHVVAIVNVYAAGMAVGWLNIPLTELFIVLPIILLIGALPISPNGLGIQEGAYVYFLTALGATPEQAFGLALILRAKVYILALLGGLVWLFLKRSVTENTEMITIVEENL